MSIVLIDQITPQMQGQTLRITGKYSHLIRLSDYNLHFATIQYKNSTIKVDTSLLGPFNFRLNSWYHVVGSLEPSGLKAHIMKNVDSLDVALFAKTALLVQKSLD